MQGVCSSHSGRGLLISYTLPERAVLSLVLPKGNIPKSASVDGAYRHSFQLRGEGVTIAITFHVKARNRKELRSISKWHILEMECTEDSAAFLLVPASRKIKTNVCGLSVKAVAQGEAELQFATPEVIVPQPRKRVETPALFVRRHRRVLVEIGRASA